MPLSDTVQVQITANTRTPTRAGFGTPLLLSYHTHFAERLRVYRQVADMLADGFTEASPAVRMARALLRQNPRVPRFKVGRLPAAHTHTVELTVTEATEGEKVSLRIQLPGSTIKTVVTFTIGAAATTTTVATAVAALLDALSGVDAAATGAVITLEVTTPGGVFYLDSLHNLDSEDVTVAGGYVAELSAVQVVDPDWYFPLMDINSAPIVEAVAAWAETQTKIFIYQSSDAADLAGTGMGSTLQALEYVRSGGFWTDEPATYMAAAVVGRVAPKPAGSVTFKFRPLTGVAPVALTPTQETNLKAENLNVYTVKAGLGVTSEGVSSSGEFLDITHGTDWLIARIQERIFGIMANADKVPYEDSSVDLFTGEIFSVLESAVGNPRNFLRRGTLSASGPQVADVDVADRAARTLPDINFGAEYAGAIHRVRIQGVLSV